MLKHVLGCRGSPPSELLISLLPGGENEARLRRDHFAVLKIRSYEYKIKKKREEEDQKETRLESVINRGQYLRINLQLDSVLNRCVKEQARNFNFNEAPTPSY